MGRFYPGEIEGSTYTIDFEELYRAGVRGLIFDIDNTLVEHDAPADERAKELFERLKRIGFKCCLVSNNDRERVELFNRDVGVFMEVKAGKPSRRGYRAAMKKMHTDESNTVVIGDQIFTDIWGANRAKLRSILVEPLAKHEEIQIVLKRVPEKLVLYLYQRARRRRETEKPSTGSTGGKKAGTLERS